MHYAKDSGNVEGFLFGDFGRPATVTMTDARLSADGGLLCLGALDRRSGLTEAVASALGDRRQGARVRHGVLELVRQRVYGLLAGYEDANDAARLREEPAFQCLLDRAEALASQSTLSRFENSMGLRALMRAAEALADRLLDRLQRRYAGATRITIDIDPTEDETHGLQQLSLFNGHYDCHCYLPLCGFVTFHDARGREFKESYLLAAMLRGGRASASFGAAGMLRRMVAKLRSRFRRARLLVRLDGGFATPEMFSALEALNVEYMVNLPKNERLRALAEPLMEGVREAARRSGETEKRYGSVMYRAGTWPHARRVVIKAEVTVDPRAADKAPRDNPRFVATNVHRLMPYYVYARDYCGRARSENRIKEFKNDGYSGRTSCSRFAANQLRLLLAHVAYALVQLLRLELHDTPMAEWQYGTLRTRLIKQPVLVARTARRTRIQMPRDGPNTDAFRRVARRLAASIN
jgi:hypothetical protein